MNKFLFDNYNGKKTWESRGRNWESDSFHIKNWYASHLAKVLPSKNIKLNSLRNVGFVLKQETQKVGKEGKNFSVVGRLKCVTRKRPVLLGFVLHRDDNDSFVILCLYWVTCKTINEI